MTQLASPETDRLTFREWREEDFKPFHAICSDSRVMRYVGDGQVWQRGRTAQFIQSATETLRYPRRIIAGTGACCRENSTWNPTVE